LIGCKLKGMTFLLPFIAQPKLHGAGRAGIGHVRIPQPQRHDHCGVQGQAAGFAGSEVDLAYCA